MRKKVILIGFFGLIVLAFINIYFNHIHIELDTDHKKLYRQIKRSTREYKDVFKIYTADDYEDGNLMIIRVNHKHEHVRGGEYDLLAQYEYSDVVAKFLEEYKKEIEIPKKISLHFIENGPRNSSGEFVKFTIQKDKGIYIVGSIEMKGAYISFTDLKSLNYTDIQKMTFWGSSIENIENLEFLSEFKNLKHIYLGSYHEGHDISDNIRERINNIVPTVEVSFNMALLNK